MNLRYVRIDIDHTFYSGVNNDSRIEFNDRMNFINNYLCLEIRRLKIDTKDKYNMILIRPSLKCKAPYSKFSELFKCLTIEVPLSEEELNKIYAFKTNEDYASLYFKLLSKGMDVLNISHKTNIIEGIRFVFGNFETGNFKNRRIHKSLRCREYNILMKFYFILTPYHFSLQLCVTKSKEVIFEGQLHETDPSEFCYDKDIKKYRINEGQVFIDDFLGHPFLSFAIEPLLKGELNRIKYQ